MSMETNFKINSHESGFALLMTLIVVGVILSVGVSLLDISIKQVRLSTNTKDSEIAFHAANAGMECARFWRRNEADDMERGEAIDVDCFGVAPSTMVLTEIIDDPAGLVSKYEYKFSWGTTNPRCTKINTLVVNAYPFQEGLTVPEGTVKTHVVGYPKDASFVCEAGGRCSIISVKGYNKKCENTTSYGTVEREVLIEL